MRKNKTKNVRGPVSTIMVLIVLVSLASLVLSLIGFQGNKTYIGNGALETSLVTVKNIISLDGLQYIIGNVVTNFINFKPLAILVIALVGIGIFEKSGLFHAMFYRFKNVKFEIVIFLTLFLGIISSIIGEYSYLFLMPFVALMYRYLNRNPILGILTVFIGITLGYGVGIIFNYDDFKLGLLTQAAANLDVDATYEFHLFSNIYIMVFLTFLLTFVGTVVIKRFLFTKFPKKQINEEENLNVSRKGFLIASVVGLFSILAIVYMLLDIKAPGAGMLLGKSSGSYMDKLFGETSPFREGIVFIITFIMMITGFVYGKISGNIKNSHEYSLGLSKSFENLGLVFVLMFFTSVMVSILDWTNMGVVISSNLVDFLSSVSLSGLPLIIIFMVIVIIMSILIPDTQAKWQLLSPTIIPLFMRANITPDFTQFVFKVADGIGKSLSPFFVYFIIMIAFLEKYKKDEKQQISIFGTLKLTLPVILMLGLLMVLFVVLWYVIGVPIGVGTTSTI